MLPQFPPYWSDSWSSWAHGRWHGHPSTSKAHAGIPSPGSLPQRKVQPFGFDFFVFSTRRSHQIGSALCTHSYSPVRVGTALKILLIVAGENGRAVCSTQGVSCAAYTRWANKHLARDIFKIILIVSSSSARKNAHEMTEAPRTDVPRQRSRLHRAEPFLTLII